MSSDLILSEQGVCASWVELLVRACSYIAGRNVPRSCPCRALLILTGPQGVSIPDNDAIVGSRLAETDARFGVAKMSIIWLKCLSQIESQAFRRNPAIPSTLKTETLAHPAFKGAIPVDRDVTLPNTTSRARPNLGRDLPRGSNKARSRAPSL
jgi:hypothetical protein